VNAQIIVWTQASPLLAGKGEDSSTQRLQRATTAHLRFLLPGVVAGACCESAAGGVSRERCQVELELVVAQFDELARTRNAAEHRAPWPEKQARHRAL
jgi:hypothetical protein